MKFKIILAILFFAAITFAQEKSNPVLFEHHSFLNGEIQKEIISFRIPYNVFLFTKINEHYEASFSLTIEIFDSLNFVLREIKSDKILTTNYEQTKSEKSYYQNFVEFEIKPGKYKLNTNLTVDGVEGQIRLADNKLVIDTLSSIKISEPLLIDHDENENGTYNLLNFENSIPLSPKEFDILIEISDKSITQIKYSIQQFDKVVKTDSTSMYSNGGIIFSHSDNAVALKISPTLNNNHIFKISNFSKLLSEGKAEIEISFMDLKKKFPIYVKWFSKPKVLNNPEYAIKLMSYIEDEEVVKTLLMDSEDKYYKNLSEFWEKSFPSNGSKFNYAMNEYYTRADYAIENFSTLNSFDGAETDRGRIYITYGKPNSIERNYTEKNEILEIWQYEKLGRTFIFKDTSGTGKFILEK
ncbi:MAG: GWxTD domain-containing protein [Ignavibacteriales bacterium]|nr:GWxTD domain-containing protein [Ignavibacteriales bacterium]